MRRTGRLFDQIVDRDNLRMAVHKALKSKRQHQEAQVWLANLEHNLQRIANQLRTHTFPVGRHHQFVIYDPKERLITAPCFEERIVHHAIMNICEPHLDRLLIFDSYACRKGKGRLACLERVRKYAARYPWFLKLDIRKYFDSIPHERLLGLWQQRFKDPCLFRLLSSIVRGYRGNLGRGFPIGSLTSQHLANFYLGWYDRFVKEQLRIPGYTRYMDDIALWSDDQQVLRDAEKSSCAYLREQLELEVKPEPHLNRSAHGMNFLGCRAFPTHLLLNRASRVRMRRRWRNVEEQFTNGEITEAELQTQATALMSYMQTPGLSTWKFRQSVLSTLMVSGREARIG